MKYPDKQLQELFGLVPIGIYKTTPKGEIIDVNPAIVNILGYPDQETLLKQEASSVFLNKQNRQKGIEKIEQSKAVVVSEYQWNRFDGGIIWVRDYARAIRDKNGKVLYFIGTIEDITDSKEADEKNRKQNKLFQLFMDALNTSLYLVDVNDYRVLLANSATYNGKLTDKLTCYTMIHHRSTPCEGSHVKCPIIEIEKTKKPVVLEHIQFIDGKPRYSEIRAFPIFNDEGNVIQIAEAIKDVTEEKETKKALKSSSLATETSMSAVFTADLKGIIIYANTAAAKMWGYKSPEEMIGTNAIEYWTKSSQGRAGELIETLLKKGHSYTSGELTGKKLDGTEFIVESNSVLIKDEKGKPSGLIGSFSDITKRLEAEAILTYSEERLKILFEYAPDGMYVIDFKGNFIEGNIAAEKLTGYKKEELIGKSFLKLKLLSLDQAAKAAKLLAKNALGKATGPDEFILKRKNGTQVPVEINTYPVKIKGKSMVLGIARDISKQKIAEEVLKEYTDNLEAIVVEHTRELQEVHEELIRKDRLAMLGKLAGGIGHDLRTPLGAIKNAVYFLNMAVENPEPDVKEMLEVIENEISISDGIITGLLDFARSKVSKKQKVNVSGLLQETLSRMQVPENIKVETILNKKLSHILADPVQIGQIFTNIIQNGFQAMPDGGTFVIKSKAVESDQVMISFSDTGVGISQENLKKLFEPLFTTKPTGTGLGLALVEMLVKEHGGTIQAESKKGKGSAFTIIFPT